MASLKRASIILGLVGLILSIPLIFMQFSKEVDWNLADFLVAGLLLAITGFAVDFVLRTTKGSRRTVLILIGIIVFLLIWAELGVGIFGSPFAGD